MQQVHPCLFCRSKGGFDIGRCQSYMVDCSGLFRRTMVFIGFDHQIAKLHKMKEGRDNVIVKQRLEALREHLTLTHELLPLMSRARTYASWYLKGMPHAAAWRAQVVRCSTYEEFMALVDDIERDVVACEAALAAGESVPAHPLEA